MYERIKSTKTRYNVASYFIILYLERFRDGNFILVTVDSIQLQLLYITFNGNNKHTMLMVQQKRKNSEILLEI